MLRENTKLVSEQMKLHGLSVAFLPVWWYCLFLNLLLGITHHCKLALLIENFPRILKSEDDLLLCSRCLGGLRCSTIYEQPDDYRGLYTGVARVWDC